MSGESSEETVINISIKSKDIESFSVTAIEHLEKGANNYILEIIKESNTLENSEREDEASKEVTSTIVRKAISSYKLKPHKNKSKKWINIICQIVSAISSIFIGVFFNLDLMDIATHGLKYMIIVLVSVFILAISILVPMIGE